MKRLSRSVSVFGRSHCGSTGPPPYRRLISASTEQLSATTMSSTHSHSHMSTPAYPTLNLGSGAKWIKNLTQDRLGQFNGGHFGDVNLGAVLFTRKEDGKDFVDLKVCVLR